MIGLVLNEEGYVTYPYEIFKHIEEYGSRRVSSEIREENTPL